MSDERVYDLIREWAAHAESEIRIHVGLRYPEPPDLVPARRSCEGYVHDAILGFLDELLRHPEADALIARRRAALAEMDA